MLIYIVFPLFDGVVDTSNNFSLLARRQSKDYSIQNSALSEVGGT